MKNMLSSGGKCLFLVVLLYYNCVLQDIVAQNKSNLAYKYLEAKKAIANLKQGTLIVVLNTFESKVEILKQNGKLNEALEFEKQIFNENQLLVQSFKKYFDFCEVKFIFSKEYSALNNLKPQYIFLDNHLHLDSSLSLKHNYFLVLKKEAVLEEAAVPKDNFKEQHSGVVVINEALVISYYSGIQVRKPFPFYVKAYDPFQYYRAVKRLNYKLHRYYKKTAKLT